MSEKLQSLLEEISSEPPLILISKEPSPPTSFDEEPAPPICSHQPNNAEPASETDSVAAPTDAVARRAQRARSLLAGLDLDTAIRFRWAMREEASERNCRPSAKRT